LHELSPVRTEPRNAERDGQRLHARNFELTEPCALRQKRPKLGRNLDARIRHREIRLLADRQHLEHVFRGSDAAHGRRAETEGIGHRAEKTLADVHG
jgi:hypothetical protein